MERIGNMEQLKKYIKTMDGLLFFFILEALAFVSFSFGNINWIFRFFGLIIALLLIPYAIVFIKKDDIKSIIMFAFPLIIYAILTSFSSFSLLAFDNWFNIATFVGLISFYFIGLMLRKIKSHKSQYVLATIGLAMALSLLIALLISIAKYGLFHISIYQGKFYFYNGVEFPVYQEAKFLYGFEISEVSISYFAQFSLLLSCALTGLLFVSYKKNKNEFIVMATIGGLGVLSLILIGDFIHLIYLIPLALFALSFKFLRNHKKYNLTMRIIIYSLVGLAFIFLALATCNALVNESGQYVFSSFHNMIASNSILNKIFNNITFMQPINAVLSVIFQSRNLFGFDISNYFLNETIFVNTRMMEIEVFKDGGIFLFLALVALIMVGYHLIRKYLKNSDDHDEYKVMIVSYLLVFTLYNSFSYDCCPIVHSENTYLPLAQQTPFLIALFFIGYISIKGEKKVETPKITEEGGK